MAPMFLVSNEKMLISANKAGITGCIPTLNFRTPELLAEAMKSIKEKSKGAFGVNLIVNKSNIHLKAHMEVLEKYKPNYIITSLGSPEETIKTFQPLGVKIICDVIDIEYAKKCESLGADAIIAVNSGAGGHAGPTPSSILVPMLKENTSLPVISAGGVGTGAGLLSAIALGAEGVSIGSPFIPTIESDVSEGYKQAAVDYGASDIGLTTKLSGSPCTVIQTPFVKKMGLDQNPLEAFLNSNKKIKKYAKMLTYYKGTKLLEKAAFSATYKSVWCAGQSIEFSKKIESVESIISRITSEYEVALKELNQKNI